MDETLTTAKHPEPTHTFNPLELLKEGAKQFGTTVVEGIKQVETSADRIVHGQGTMRDYVRIGALVFGEVLIVDEKRAQALEKK